MIRFLGLGFLISLSTVSSAQVWNCGLHVQGQKLPFQLERLPSQDWILWNGSEQIGLEKGIPEADSLRFPVLVFDAWLKIPANPGALFFGSFSKGDAKVPGYQMSFTAKVSKDFSPKKPVVRAKKQKDEYLIGFYNANGLMADSGILRIQSFQQTNRVEATILTETGDFRYLNGVLNDEGLKLSTFDGGHTYLFKARRIGDGFVGRFYYSRSGSDSVSIFPIQDRKLKSGFRQFEGRFSFSAKDRTGQIHTEKDPEFLGKPMIVQVLGTWCPNCMDESRFLVEMYPLIREKVRIVGLAFERKNQDEYGFERIEIVKGKLKIPYPIYLAGPASKDSASKRLPSVAPIEAFPTTVFVKSDGTILKAHSGFTGPATGKDYLDWKQEFLKLVDLLAQDEEKK